MNGKDDKAWICSACGVLTSKRNLTACEHCDKDGVLEEVWIHGHTIRRLPEHERNDIPFTRKSKDKENIQTGFICGTCGKFSSTTGGYCLNPNEEGEKEYPCLYCSKGILQEVIIKNGVITYIIEEKMSDQKNPLDPILKLTGLSEKEAKELLGMHDEVLEISKEFHTEKNRLANFLSSKKELSDKDITDMSFYHKPEKDMHSKFGAVSTACELFLKVIRDNVPDCKDRDKAIERVREGRMWANSAIANKGKF